MRTVNPSDHPSAGPFNTPFTVMTDAIDAAGLIDPRYTRELDNSSPELRWENEPEGTESFAVVVEDPDAQNAPFPHWLVYRIPKDLHHLPAGIPAQDTLPNGIRQGLNGFRKLGYAGPCPPFGPAHHYRFRVYALKAHPEVASRASRDELISGISGLVIASTDLVGRFQRVFQRAG